MVVDVSGKIVDMMGVVGDGGGCVAVTMMEVFWKICLINIGSGGHQECESYRKL